MRKRRSKKFQGKYVVLEDRFGNKFVVKKYSRFGEQLLKFLSGKKCIVRFYGININPYLKFAKPKVLFTSNDHPNIKCFRSYILDDGLKTLITLINEE